MSLLSRHPPPPQQALFFDGDGLSPINPVSNRVASDSAWLGYLDYLPQALPYRLLSQPRVLILGLGGGVDLQLALRQGAAHVEVVELNPQVVGIVGAVHQAASGRVRIRVAEARGFVARSRDSYDLIQVSMMDSFTASAAGVQALSESYLYTVEAFEAYLARLAPGGLLMVTRWLKIPPRDSLKLFATAVAALSRAGVENPGRQLVLIRSWNTSTLLVRKGGFGLKEIASLRAFCREMAFDTAYFPGITAAQANRFNRLQSPYLFQGARALLSDRAESFLADYKFRLNPATDDRPHFFHFFRWSTLPELLRLRHQGGGALLELGYLILVVTLAQALLAGGLLILLPLWAAPDTEAKRSGWRLQGYFFLLGLAFIFIEIAFIQKFMLLLNHPLYAVAVVLAGFLGFAGLGSGAVDSLTRARPKGWPSPLMLAVAAILLLATLYLVGLPSLFEVLLQLPDAFRILFCLLLIGPLAFFMGMLFPIGLARVADIAPAFLPWAWGLNGFASVLGATLATLLAIELGFRAIVLIALGFYLLAVILLPVASDTDGRSTKNQR
jgi:SAM-dependent methyltransferase